MTCTKLFDPPFCACIKNNGTPPVCTSPPHPSIYDRSLICQPFYSVSQIKFSAGQIDRYPILQESLKILKGINAVILIFRKSILIRNTTSWQKLYRSPHAREGRPHIPLRPDKLYRYHLARSVWTNWDWFHAQYLSIEYTIFFAGHSTTREKCIWNT